MPVSRTRRRAATPTRTLALLLLSAATAATVPSACGARTGLEVPLPDPPPPECETFEDCDGAEDLCNPVGCELEQKVRPEDGRRYLVGTCVALEPVDCDDGDECTNDSCAPESGRCGHAPAAIDADGDGFRGPRAGFSAGEPGSCGDDCDDTSDRAYPGATEVCDGVDNDCNGIVDDGATWLPLDLEPIRLSNDGTAPASPGSVAWSGAEWLATFSDGTGGWRALRSRLSPEGLEIGPSDERISEVNADSFPGPVLWAGDRFGTAWSDRRFGDYEVYFTLFAPNGDKITPDARLSVSAAFSLNPDIAWTGQEFVVAWQDEADGVFEIRAHRLDRDGAPLGAETVVVESALNAVEWPTLAASSLGTGLAYGVGTPDDRRVGFTVLEPDLGRRFEPVLLEGERPLSYQQAVAPNLDEYVVVWVDETTLVESTLWGAVIDQAGGVVVPPRPIVEPGAGQFARYPTVRALGDRILVVYSDTRDADDYELWAKLLDARLEPLEPERRITFASGMTVYPRAAFGPDGNLGVLFRDDRLGEQHAWFTRLGCAVATIP